MMLKRGKWKTIEREGVLLAAVSTRLPHHSTTSTKRAIGGWPREKESRGKWLLGNWVGAWEESTYARENEGKGIEGNGNGKDKKTDEP